MPNKLNPVHIASPSELTEQAIYEFAIAVLRAVLRRVPMTIEQWNEVEVGVSAISKEIAEHPQVRKSSK